MTRDDLKIDVDKAKKWYIITSKPKGSSRGGKYPTKGDTIQYIYTNSQHNNPLCRVAPLEILQKRQDEIEKYYENPGNNRNKKKWYDELHEERTKDIQAERMMENNIIQSL